MNSHAYGRHAVRFGRMALVALALTMIGACPLAAQRWMDTFGGANPTGERGDGVTECANGDVVAVGTSVSATGQPQVYAVRTNASGNPVWHQVYNVAGLGSCTAADVKECANGNLALCGAVGNSASRVAFVMRLTSGGAFLWATTARTTLPINFATSILEAQFGNGVTTHAGDIVIGGATQSNVTGVSDGFIARFNSGGTQIWSTTYDVRNPGSWYDQITSIDETQILSASGTVGDIVAVGASSASAAGPFDIWVSRVDGNTGAIGAAPQGSALFGTPQNDLGFTIHELRNGGHPGDLLVAGSSAGRPAPSSNDEAIVLQLLPDPCDAASPRAARYLGDNGTARDGATCAAEITAASVGTVGNIVVGGNNAPGWFGGSDGFLQQFQEGTLAKVGNYYYYGGSADDIMAAMAEVTHAPNSQGFVFTGRTRSPGFIPVGNSQNLWIAKVDGGLNNTCGYEFRTMSDAPATLAHTCVPLSTLWLTPGTGTGPAVTPPWLADIVCFVATKPAIGMNAASGTGSLATLEAYPSPLRSGSALTVNYTLSETADVNITIVDIAGKEVYRNNGTRTGGRTTELVPTSGWAAGTYLVRATANGRSLTTRTAVLGR
ncbi:MAG: T9SS type A sorting domain-containing protein [Bacteroidetes bacterium]|nr:T9SS type A sorting domain-containing protein [Bacteroidota bacterium]